MELGLGHLGLPELLQNILNEQTIEVSLLVYSVGSSIFLSFVLLSIYLCLWLRTFFGGFDSFWALYSVAE